MTRYRPVILFSGVFLLGCALTAALGQGERHRLYTPPDPSSTGGIRGVILRPGRPILQILAMPPDEPRLVYEGKVTGPGNRGFLFEGLPMSKYNLLVVYENEFYEGLELTRDKNTLTKADEQKIEKIITDSEPFFTRKIIHRVEGTTGRGNEARCICTFLRDRAAKGSSGFRRTFKLVWLKDVGPGWQVVQKRDLYPVSTDPQHALPRHSYSLVLSKIRVTDQVKDLGEINLTN